MRSFGLSALALLFLSGCARHSDMSHIEQAKVTALPQVSINEVMESVIVPATNTLWGADDPQTDEEWQQLEDAAVMVIAAGSAISLGGSGPRDNEWVQSPAWKAFAVEMTVAAVDSLEAIRARDIEALFEAGYVMYPPCESCHKQFNPAVTGQ